MEQQDSFTVFRWDGDQRAAFLERLPKIDIHNPIVRAGDWIVLNATACGVIRAKAITWIAPIPSLDQRLTWLLPSMTEFIEDAEQRAQESVSDDVFPHDGASLVRLRGLLRDACQRWLEESQATPLPHDFLSQFPRGAF